MPRMPRQLLFALLALIATAGILSEPLRADEYYEEPNASCQQVDERYCGNKKICFCSAAVIVLNGIVYCLAPGGPQCSEVPVTGPRLTNVEDPEG